MEKLVADNNLLDGKHNELITDTSKLIMAVHYTIFDLGLTKNILIEGVTVVNKHRVLNPVSVTLLNDKTIESTHTHIT